MGRPKKQDVANEFLMSEESKETMNPIPTPTSKASIRIVPLSVDFSNEGLNDIARKINQIIEYLHG